MNIKHLCAFLMLTSVSNLYTCQAPQILAKLDAAIKIADEEYSKIESSVLENPQWQTLFECSEGVELVNDFYTTQEGKEFTYWYMKLDCLIKMERYYKENVAKTPKSSLYVAMNSVLNVDHRTTNKDKQKIRHQLETELRSFIQDIDKQRKE